MRLFQFSADDKFLWIQLLDDNIKLCVNHKISWRYESNLFDATTGMVVYNKK